MCEIMLFGYSAVNEASVLKKWLHILCNELAERIRTDAAALNRCPHSLVVYHRYVQVVTHCDVHNLIVDTSTLKYLY
jgi:hypothetical protein